MKNEMDYKKADELFAVLRPKIKEVAMSIFGRATVMTKGEGVNDIVTEADIKVQQIIIEEITKMFPGEGIVAEEKGGDSATASEAVWYIDPIDGTRNFATGVPLFGVLVARAISGEVVSAMDYLPATDEMYVAHRGIGATKNGVAISCSASTDFAKSYGLVPVRSGGAGDMKIGRALISICPSGVWANALGSVAVQAAFVSDGRRDWYLSKGNNSWDYAAPSLLAKEAGCAVLNYDGGDWKMGDRSLVLVAPGFEAQIRTVLKFIGEDK